MLMNHEIFAVTTVVTITVTACYGMIMNVLNSLFLCTV